MLAGLVSPPVAGLIPLGIRAVVGFWLAWFNGCFWEEPGLILLNSKAPNIINAESKITPIIKYFKLKFFIFYGPTLIPVFECTSPLIVCIQALPPEEGVPPPQTLAVHVWLPEQMPQVTVRFVLQLSVPVRVPQFLPRRLQKAGSVSGVQTAPPQTLEVPPPPQVWGLVQTPQVTVRFVLQLSDPVTVPQFLPSLEQNVEFDSGVHNGGLPVGPLTETVTLSVAD